MSGVGSTEPPESEGAGFAGAGAGTSGVGSTEPPESEGAGFAGAGAGTEIAIEELVARLGEVPLLDVRTPGEYGGSAGSHCDPRQGHIPGAVNIDIYRLTELDAAEIEAATGIELGGEVVAYCHSGTRSAIATQLLRSLGYDARNYVGSWHEWSRHDELPFETDA